MRARFQWNTPEETQTWGEALGERVQNGDVIALIGDLGTGKTTLTQGIARGMGITEPVSSPTFALVQEYMGRLPLFHCDPYRLEDPAALFSFGFEEYFERGGVVVIEWADLISDALPEDQLVLTLQILGLEADSPRQCQAEAHGARPTELLQSLLSAPPIAAQCLQLSEAEA